MFLDIWEPHQTSGFLTAFLCWIYQRVTGTAEYLVLYLRICGALIQAAVSIFLYRTLTLSFSRFGAMVAAFFFYNTLPKQIQTPEFSNMLIWFSVLAMLSFAAQQMLAGGGRCLRLRSGIVLSILYPGGSGLFSLSEKAEAGFIPAGFRAPVRGLHCFGHRIYPLFSIPYDHTGISVRIAADDDRQCPF